MAARYTSAAYAALSGECQVTLSVGRKGQCRDNAAAESFCASLKGELIDTRPGRHERQSAGRSWNTPPGTTAPGPHRDIAQRVPDGKHDGGHLAVADLDRGRIYRKPVLGGLINEYSRGA